MMLGDQGHGTGTVQQGSAVVAGSPGSTVQPMPIDEASGALAEAANAIGAVASAVAGRAVNAISGVLGLPRGT